MTGRDNDPDERKTATAIGGNLSWSPGVHTPDDTEQPTKVLDATKTRTKTVPGEQEDVDEARTRIQRVPTPSGEVDLSRAPVGWIVITAGPGIGSAFPLSYGSNRIGRGAGIEVALNFGDESISRGAHARLVYDLKGRSFYLAPGEGTGLTYQNGAPVLSPISIAAEAQIEIGNTHLRFVPLCGASFDWLDADVKAERP